MKRKENQAIPDDEISALLCAAQDAKIDSSRLKQTDVVHSIAFFRKIWFWAFIVLLLMFTALLRTDLLLLRFVSSTELSTNPTQLRHELSNKANADLRMFSLQPGTSKGDDKNISESTSLQEPVTPGLMTKTQTKKRTESVAKSQKTKATMRTTASSTASIEIGSSPATFSFRCRSYTQLNNQDKKALTQKWGRWLSLQDAKAPRPALPCHQYSHCDVPRASFPQNAWQTDPEFLKPFLTQAQELITRAQEAILAEYGQSTFDRPNKTFAERSLNFQLDMLTLDSNVHPPDSKKVAIDNGGWTTHRSFQGLVRRLLHAIMTQDTFTFVLGGHSVAAGHGNLFKQSYAMQFHQVMEPVFGRLGVQLTSYNFGKGGIGTAQDAMGMGSLWGKEIDFCLWDSGMTEFSSSGYDLFARQALISGNRVPILWNGFLDVLETLHNEADVDIGGPGTGLLGIPVTQSLKHAAEIPFAARYLKCAPDWKDLCDDNRYNARCWVKRPDFTPPVKKGVGPGSGGSHHPGFRTHQLIGRVLAFTVLMGLQEALMQWRNTPNLALPDSAWHVAEYYDNIRTKLAKLTTTPCFNDTNMASPRICYTPMKAATEYTPRAFPAETSIRSILTDTTYIPAVPGNIYSGPDVYNPVLEPPKGEVDFLAIVENDDLPTNASRRKLVFLDWTYRRKALAATSDHETGQVKTASLGRDKLIIGRGWHLHATTGDVHCNGTYDSECSRSNTTSCLLYGHNDGIGGLLFDSFSGWMLMRLKGVKEGLIIVKIETWLRRGERTGPYGPQTNPMTEGWTEENNGTTVSKRRLREFIPPSFDIKNINSAKVDHIISQHQRRQLNIRVPQAGKNLCPEFKFDYAINGHVKTLTKDEFMQMRKHVQMMVETWTLVDDPKFTSGKEMDVEVGIRMRGCQRINTFKLTHVYWA